MKMPPAAIEVKPLGLAEAMSLLKDRARMNTGVTAGTPLFGFGSSSKNKNRLYDIVRHLIERKMGKRTRASQWWAMLRNHVVSFIHCLSGWLYLCDIDWVLDVSILKQNVLH